MKSNTEQSTKQRAAGTEKSQDRPTHTELKTLKEDKDNFKTKEEQQQSSSSSQDIDGNNFDFENEQLPVVELTTPNPGIRSTLAHMATQFNIRQHIFKNWNFNYAFKRPIKRTCYTPGLSLTCHLIHLLFHRLCFLLHMRSKSCRMRTQSNSYSNFSP